MHFPRKKVSGGKSGLVSDIINTFSHKKALMTSFRVNDSQSHDISSFIDVTDIINHIIS